jgi:hypothetical protein
MSRAKIKIGVWERQVPARWKNYGEGRTDIFKTVLSDPRLQFARFIFSNGFIVLISAEELRHAVVGGKSRHDDKIWGPFNINPYQARSIR